MENLRLLSQEVIEQTGKKKKKKKNQQTSRYVEYLNRIINELELISILEDYTLKLKNIHPLQVLMKTR